MFLLKTFFITSILGFIMESVFHSTSGILYGPWTPVYGIGSILIILISNYIFKKLKTNKYLEIFIVFIFCTVLLTLIELIGGILIEKIFEITFWDYSNFKFSLGKYICLEMSLLWGLFSIIFLYTLKPLLDYFLPKMPNYLFLIASILFTIDIIITLIIRA